MARRKELAQKSKLKTSDIFSEESSESSDSSGGKAPPARKGRALSSDSPNSSEVDEGREAGSKSWLIPKTSPDKRPAKKFYDSSVSSDLSEDDEEVGRICSSPLLPFLLPHIVPFSPSGDREAEASGEETEANEEAREEPFTASSARPELG